MENLPIQSPQAAALNKFVEFPVSYFNGIPNISLPLYDVRSGDIDLPISLSYHAGGIRVNEEASWVGLGWALNAGGVISHDVKGIDDDCGSQRFFNKYFPTNMGNTYYEDNMDAEVIGGTNLLDINGNLVNQTTLFGDLGQGNSVADGEPDLYLYNFGNYSGKFTWINGQMVDLTHNNIQFTKGVGNITAITPDGYSYQFDTTEKTFTGNCPTTVAYYLTQITSPKGKTMSLQYKSFKQLYDANAAAWSTAYDSISLAFTNGDYVAQMPTLFESFANMQFLAGYTQTIQPVYTPRVCSIYTPYTQIQYLDKIVFDKGYIQFSKSPRKDLYGVKLDSISIYRSDSSLVKSIGFNYDYFVGNSDDGLFSTSLIYTGFRLNYPLDYRKNRLRLSAMQEDGARHSFTYDTAASLPLKSSFGQDYWGYFNNQGGNTTLIPDFRRYSQSTTLPVSLSSFVGADREQDSASTVGFALQKITYPTKGSTSFQYELNQYNNLGGQQQYQYVSNTVSATDTGVGVQTNFFTLSQPTYVTITGHLFCNNGPDLGAVTDCGCYFSQQCSNGAANSLWASIVKVDPVTHAVDTLYANLEWDKYTQLVQSTGGNFTITNQLLSAGTYEITANYPDNKAPGILGQRMASLVVNYFARVPLSVPPQENAGGLRVKQITDFDSATNQSMVRNYTYTGGFLMHYPQFYLNRIENLNMYVTVVYPIGQQTFLYVDDWAVDYLYSTPVVPYSFSANGALVGYPKVTETWSNGSNGRTEYYYKTAPDKLMNISNDNEPGVPATPYLDNGFLQKTLVYDKNNALLKETDNNQVILLTTTYWPFKYSVHYEEADWVEGLPPATPSFPMTNWALSYYGYFTFYPLQVGKVLTQTTTERDFTNTRTLQTTKQYTYNSQGNIKSMQETSSNGSLLETDYAYAPDYTGVSSGFIQTMNTRNMISIPVETLLKRNGNTIDGNYTTYRVHDNIITPYQTYRIETPSPQVVTSSAPSGTVPSQFVLKGTVDYDANGNLAYSQPASNIFKSYIWDYNKALPIAEAVNAADSDIAYSSFETTGGGNWQIPSTLRDATGGITGKYSYNLSNGAITKASLNTSKSYVVSYWSKSGSASVNGSTATGQVSRGGYTYFEHAIPTGSASVTVSGTVSIDELRLYPSAGQMTTYTWDPIAGMINQCDVNNHVTYYEYDKFARLKDMKDQDGNILRTFDYNYKK